MTAEPLTAAEAAVVARFEAAPPAEECAVERVARAILHAVLGDTDGGLVLDGDLPASEIARLIREEAAPAALTAMRPAPDTTKTEIPAAPWKVGDPDPTPWSAFDCCGAQNPIDGYECTWGARVGAAEHPAWHVAGDGDRTCAVWPADAAS